MKTQRELMTENRLSHAAGALSDIQILITSCIPKDKRNKKLHEIAESVLQRILCSAHTIHHKPSWYIHDWGEKLWEDYLSGKIKACGSELSCIKEAKRIKGEK